MDKLEELERRWRKRVEELGSTVDSSRDREEELFCEGCKEAYDDCADDLSALRRDYVLVPREPTQEDVERVAQKIAEASFQVGVYPENIARAAWAAIVGGKDET